MTRTTKIVAFSLPPALAEEVKAIAQEEQRTQSELFREMLRIYRAYRKQRPEPEMDEELTLQILLEAQEEQRRNPMSPEELVAEFRSLAKRGARRAKKLGINAEDEEEINRLVYERRASWKKTKKNNRT